MAEQLIILDGSTFFFSDANGDVEARQAEGYFHDDVRHLSLWRLLVDGNPLEALVSKAVDYYSARIVAAPAGKDPPFSVIRDRFVTEGVHEDVIVCNHSGEERHLRLELCFGADFADILEAQASGAQAGETSVELGGRTATLRYDRDGFRRGTVITFSKPCSLEEGRARFDIRSSRTGSGRPASTSRACTARNGAARCSAAARSDGRSPRCRCRSSSGSPRLPSSTPTLRTSAARTSEASSTSHRCGYGREKST
jgi:N-terminal domain of (some) glycogen debranching enzymes